MTDREEFEAWYNDNFTELSAGYQERSWQAWQAARVTRPTPSVNQELLSALERLVFLHQCEQEGLSSGVPSPQQWLDAVEAGEQAISKANAQAQQIKEEKCI